MKIKYKVTDNEQNRKNCLELIGQIIDNPPSYCSVEMIKEKRSMWEIFKKQSPMFVEDNVEHMADDFIVKCTREGYGKNEIVKGLAEFYSQSPEAGKAMIDPVLIKFLGLDPDPKKFNLMEFRKKK